MQRSGGRRWGSALTWAGLLGAAMVLSGFERARAGAVEGRTFRVLVDQKPAGSYHMTISSQDDGTYVVTGQADIRVTVLRITAYHYSYNGTEVWKDGRLIRLNSTTDDDGQRFAVSAVAEGEGLRVRVNGQERLAPGEVWTTSCWRLPAAKFRNAALVLLDADTARELHGNLMYVGTDRVNVAGQAQDCAHYRVTGDTQLELWFDGGERLVRQESVEQGHRTVLEMVGR